MISQKKDTSIIMRYLISLRKYLYLIAFCLVALGLVRNIMRATYAKRRLNEAKDKLANLEEINRNLKNELEEVTSGIFVESQARDKLGLAREGEVVLILPPDEEVKKFSIKREELNNYQLPEENWKKWWDVFF